MARSLDAAAHGSADARLLQAHRRRPTVPLDAQRALAARLAEDPAGREASGLVLTTTPARLLEAWVSRRPRWSEQARAEAAELLEDRATCLGRVCELADPAAWHRDPLRPKPWPRRPHARIRLDHPDQPGDARLQWEPARFHHALRLGRARLAAGGGPYAEAFARHVDAFARGNRPFRGIHWSVGMEVAIRAANLVFALEFLRGDPALDEPARARLVDWLLLHGIFLEHHIERHPLGFTTNHTLADHAGLAVLGRFFRESACGERWMEISAAGLQACLQEQVLIGGAHAEGALPYERFALEAALVALLCLGPRRGERLHRPLLRMAGHLRRMALARGLPFIGDGDDSFFPPFGLAPDARLDPLDAEPVLQLAAKLLEAPALRGEAAPAEAPHWLGAGEEPVAKEAARAEGSASSRAAEPGPAGERGFWEHRGAGGVRFRNGRFLGHIVSRGSGEGWLPTHGHNDLLSVVIEVDGTPLVIDPGTGGYACDRALRHRLRATAAHSTVQLDTFEQSPLRERATFEGPHIVPGGIDLVRFAPLRVCAWHGGFGGRAFYTSWARRQRALNPEAVRRSWEDASAGFQHTRRLFGVRGQLCLEDIVFSPTPQGAEAAAWEEIGPGESHTTTLRFCLAPGLVPRLEFDERWPVERAAARAASPGDPEPAALQGRLSFTPPMRRRPACVVPLPGGEAWFLLLRPWDSLWQIEPGVASRRYGEQVETPVLTATHTGPLPHHWRTVVQFRSRV